MLFSCEEYYDPQIEKQAPAYVFDGLITDQPGPYYIRITKTNGYSDDTVVSVENANVGVKCSDGKYYKFSYSDNGYYYSDSSLFVGENGKSYQMQVIINEGLGFTSQWEEMLPCPDIEELTAEYYENQKVRTIGSEYFDEVESGILVMNTTDAAGYTPYYRYECEFIVQTQQHYYPTAFPIERYIYKPYFPYGVLYIADATQYANNKITANKLLTTSTLMFQHRYDTIIPDMEFTIRNNGEIVLVRQYSMSEGQYKYWEAVNDQQVNKNYLFGQIENKPVSNISGSANTLGYFCVSAVKENCRAFGIIGFGHSIKAYDMDYYPRTDTMAVYDSIQDFTLLFAN